MNTQKLRRTKTKRFLKVILGICAGVILLWGLHLGYHVAHLMFLVRDATQKLEDINIAAVGEYAADTADSISAIHRDLSPIYPVFNLLQKTPRIGAFFGQVHPVMDFMNSMAQASKYVYRGVEPILNEYENGLDDSLHVGRVLSVLSDAESQFAHGFTELQHAGNVRHKLEPELFPDSIRPYYNKLDENFDILMVSLESLQIAPVVLGHGQEQKYLLLAQNQEELRASGGFISGIGILSFLNGDIIHFALGDSYAIDDFSKPYPKPPEPLRRFMLADYWVARDSNWSPHFPTAAHQAQELYALSTGVETQGVIAFDQVAVRNIMEMIGPVKVSGYEGRLTEENVISYMYQAWGQVPKESSEVSDWWLQRKDFMNQLGEAILEQVMAGSDINWYMRLGRKMLSLLESGHIQVYFKDPDTQNFLAGHGWDGSIDPGDGDFFSLIDSNVGFNKADALVQREVRYWVDLRDIHHPTAEITAAYHHKGKESGDQCKQQVTYGEGSYQDMQQRCYFDYWRIYSQGGTRLISSRTELVPGDLLLNPLGWSGDVEASNGEMGTQVWAGLLVLSLGDTRDFKLEIELPSEVIKRDEAGLLRYQLRVQKQPGLEFLPFKLEITLPNGYVPVVDNADWQKSDLNSWIWEANLIKRTEIDLAFQFESIP